MTKVLSEDQNNLLDGLLKIYRQEVEAIYGIAMVWGQLKEEARDKCAEDFDQAIIARETFLEEIAEFKDAGIKVDQFEIELYYSDLILVEYNDVVREIYNLDIKVFLNIKKPKGLLKGK